MARVSDDWSTSGGTSSVGEASLRSKRWILPVLLASMGLGGCVYIPIGTLPRFSPTKVSNATPVTAEVRWQPHVASGSVYSTGSVAIN